jgi:hypothetical protein
MGHGAKEGAMLSMLGHGAGKAAQAVKKATESGVASWGTGVGVNASGFGGLTAVEQLLTEGEINPDEVRRSVVLGGALGLPGLPNALFGRAFGNYATASPKAKLVATNTKESLESMRDRSADLREKANKSEDNKEKEGLRTQADAVDNLADIKAISEDVTRDPARYHEVIEKDPEMNPQEKKFYKDQINETVAKNDPQIKKAEPISKAIEKVEADIKAIDENPHISDPVKTAKKESLLEEKSRLNKELIDVFKTEALEEIKAAKEEVEIKEEKPTEVFDKTNKLLDLKQRFNAKTTTERANDLQTRQQIIDLSSELGHTVTGTDKLDIKTNGKSLGRPRAELGEFTPLTDRSEQTQTFVKDAIELGKTATETIMGIGMKKAEIEQAIKNIEEGKDTKTARDFIEIMDTFVEQGYAEVRVGKGIDAQTFRMELKEFTGKAEVKKELPIEETSDEVIEANKEVDAFIEAVKNEDGTIDFKKLGKAIKEKPEFEELIIEGMNEKQIESLKTKIDEQIKEQGEGTEGLAGVEAKRVEDAIDKTDFKKTEITRGKLVEHSKAPFHKELKETTTEEHMEIMSEEINKGKSFDEAHQAALKVEADRGGLPLEAPKAKKDTTPPKKEEKPPVSTVEAEIREDIKGISEGTTTPKESGIGKKFAELKKTDAELHDTLVKEFKPVSEEFKKKQTELETEKLRESGKAKIAEGLDDIATIIGAKAAVDAPNPLTKPKAFEAVKKLADGLFDLGVSEGKDYINSAEAFLEELFKQLKSRLEKKHFDEFSDQLIKDSKFEEKKEAVEEIKEEIKEEAEEQEDISTVTEPLVIPTGEKRLLTRAHKGTKSEVIKSSIEETGLEYRVETVAEAKAAAERLIEDIGEKAALEAVKNNQVEGGAAAYIWSEMIDGLGKKAAAEKDPAKAEELEKQQAEIIKEFDKSARSAGRFLSNLPNVYEGADFHYAVDVQINKYKDLNKGVIPAEVEAKFREYDKELKEINKKLVDAETKLRENEKNTAFKGIENEIEREKKSRKKNIKSQQKKGDNLIAEGTEDLAKALGIVQFAVGEVRPEVVSALAKIGKGLITKGLATSENVLLKVEEYLKDNFKGKVDFKKHRTGLAKELSGARETTPGKIKIPTSLIKRIVVEQNIKNIEDLTVAVHKELKEGFPGITEREVRDAITGYGNITSLNKGQLETSIRKMKRMGKLISGIEDAQNKRRPLRSGLQRDKPGSEERAMQKELRELLKDLPIEPAEVAREWKTALDGIKSRLKNNIEDLQRRLDTGEKPPEKKVVKLDLEAKELKEERDRLRKAVEDLEGKSELTDEQRIDLAIKGEERSIANLERKIIEKELETPPGKKIPQTPELKALKERSEVLKKELLELRKEAGIPEIKRLEQAKIRTKKAIDELQERIKEKNFAPKPKPKPIISDSELTDLKAQKIAVREKYDKEFYKKELEDRSLKQKIKDGIGDAWGLLRGLRATGEFSFVLIQGLIPTIANPRHAVKSFKNALSHFGSETRQEKWLNKIKAQEWYPELKESKLALTEVNAKISAREELFVSDWANMIWATIGSPLKLLNNKNAFEKWKAASPLKAVERAAVGYLDTIRVLRFLDGKEMLEIKGIEFKDDPQAYKDLADAINTMTGRASLELFGLSVEGIKEGLSRVFFSPRNWASVIKTSTPYAFYHFGKMRAGAEPWKPSVAQKIALTDFSKFVGLTTSLVTLAAVHYNNDGDPETGVEMDPTSSDFAKIKIGNRRIDPWGGRIQQVVLQARFLIESILKGSGKVVPLGTPFQASTRKGLLIDMGTNKLSPPTHMLDKYLDTHVRKDGMRVTKFGEEYVFLDELKENLHPIYWDTIEELLEDDPTALDGLLMFYAFFGGGVNVYSNDKKKKTKTPGFRQLKINKSKAGGDSNFRQLED